MANVSVHITARLLVTIITLSAVRGQKNSGPESDDDGHILQKLAAFGNELRQQELNDGQQKLIAAELESLLATVNQGQRSPNVHQRQLMETVSETGCDTEMPRDCADIFVTGSHSSGVYTVYVDSARRPIKVYCDMTTDGGGWTVFQRRQDGSVDFYRNWDNYTTGFGDPSGEFWLGNDNLHWLTNGQNYRLRVDLADFEGNTSYADYADFMLASSCDEYRMSYSTYCGTAGDSLDWHLGQRFSTWDEDNDNWADGSCAENYKGAWWYNNCHHSNLNGQYLGGPHESLADGVNWYYWTGLYYSLKFTEMKVRPSALGTGCEASMPRDCADIALSGSHPSGVYTVYVDSARTPIQVYCDLTTDGGGWTVLQRRQDGSEDFYRTWADYASGFGDLTGEFWLGNDNLHSLTAGKNYRLRVNLADFEGNTSYAEYGDFMVDSACNKYRMLYSTYCGTAGNSLSLDRHHGQRFSTWDQDNDWDDEECAVTYKGAWWYNGAGGGCFHSNLNGQYLGGPHESYADGVNWYHWTGWYYSLQFTEMKIRPSDF